MIEDGGKELVNEASLWPGGKFVTTNIVVSQSSSAPTPAVVSNLLKGQIKAVDYINRTPRPPRRPPTPS